MNRHERRAMARLADDLSAIRQGRPLTEAHVAAVLGAFEDAVKASLVRLSARQLVLETILEERGLLTEQVWADAVATLTRDGMAPEGACQPAQP